MRRRNQNFDKKFEIRKNFSSNNYIRFFCLYQCFEVNKFLRRREKTNPLKTITPVIKPFYSHIAFDGKFSAYLKFLVRILIPPMHFEISPILVNCVGGFLHTHCRKIVFSSIFGTLVVCKIYGPV